jgi:hypothetical protein
MNRYTIFNIPHAHIWKENNPPSKLLCFWHYFLCISSASDNMEHVGSVGSYERINLSTKQSAKIAQISKNIEEQVIQ